MASLERSEKYCQSEMPPTHVTTVGGRTLDRYDMQILSVLNANPRISASDLGKIVHLSRTAVSRRIGLLTTAGVFEKSPRIVSLAALGLNVNAFIELYAKDKNPERLCNRLLHLPEILKVSIVAGRSLLMIDVVAPDIDHLKLFMKDIQQYGRTETKIVFVEERSEMPLIKRLDRIFDTQLVVE